MSRRASCPVIAILLALLLTIIPFTITVALSPTAPRPYTKPYRQLTSGIWNDVSPSWSPDGNYIAFMSDRDGGWEVWIITPNKSWQRLMTQPDYVSANPSWSPDSSSIAFWSQQGTRTDVRIAFIANSTILTVTDGSHAVAQGQPKWSPDGTRLAFWLQDGGLRLAVADLKTSTVKILADAMGSSPSASWLNNGHILYNDNSTGEYVIDWVDVNTGVKGLLISGNGSFVSPAANANATFVAFYSNIRTMLSYLTSPFGGYEIYVGRVGGSNLIFLYVTGTGTYMSHFSLPYMPGFINWSASPAWSASGTKILYTANDPEFGDGLYVWDVANWTTAMLVPLQGNERDPAWSPDSVTAAFSCDIGGFYHIWLINTAGSGMAVRGGY